jgi:D-serine deaminase-like pyridoxal phosphate-dependent protein
MHAVGSRINEIDTPCLWVDLDMLESNIAYLANYFRKAGVQWRPHVKGIRVPAIAQKAILAGAIGVTCATVAEAETMVDAGIHGILIANQVVGQHKIARLLSLCRHADMKVAVDDAANVAALGQAVADRGVDLGVVVEVDVGQQRAGVAPGQAAVELSRCVQHTPGLRFCGLMGWEGHTRAIADTDKRHRAIAEAIDQLTTTAALCRKAGLPVSIVSGGGSGTYDVTAFHRGITEIQAGGAIFCDVMYQKLGVETQPCLFMRSTVTSRPTPDRIVCDAGFKTLPTWRETPRPLGLARVKSIHMSAEHGVVTLEAPNRAVRAGDALDFIVGYGDATIFLHDRLYGVCGGTVEAVWMIQGRGKMSPAEDAFTS